MGSLYKNGRVRSYIMILLVITALLIAAPIKKLITNGVNDRITGFTTLLHDKTGLSISYQKLSPSILSNFYIHNIRVFDDEGNQLLSVNKTRVSYSLFNLIKKATAPLQRRYMTRTATSFSVPCIICRIQSANVSGLTKAKSPLSMI